MSRARKIDEEEKEIRRRQEEEMEAIKEKQRSETVSGRNQRTAKICVLVTLVPSIFPFLHLSQCHIYFLID